MASSPQPSHPLTSLPTPPLSLPQLHRWNPDPPGLRHKTYGDPEFQIPKASAGPMGSSPCAAHVHHLCPPSSCRWPPPHQEPGAPGHHRLVMPFLRLKRTNGLRLHTWNPHRSSTGPGPTSHLARHGSSSPLAWGFQPRELLQLHRANSKQGLCLSSCWKCSHPLSSHGSCFSPFRSAPKHSSLRPSLATPNLPPQSANISLQTDWAPLTRIKAP